jgi:4-amino-4-deoxy-L-arabinose transferase-like glycosyltransferase
VAVPSKEIAIENAPVRPQIVTASSRLIHQRPQPGFAPERSYRFWMIVLLGVAILFFSSLRFHLRNVPLERDEGEYAYAGQLILQGIPPYVLAYNMKLPGTYAAYALLMAVFGQSAAGIHLGMILVNAAATVLMFFLAEKLFGSLAGIGTACTYALLSNSESVLGFAGHATHFVVLAAVAGLLALLHAIESKRIPLYFLSGFFLGLAFVFKQPGLFLTLFGSVYLIASEWRKWRTLRNWEGIRRFAAYGLGAILPFALTCLIMLFAGQLGKMWFWTFSYARQYASVMMLWQGWENFFVVGAYVLDTCYPMWILGALGLAAIAWDPGVRKHVFFLIGLLVFSWCAVCTGFYFRPHYFILVLPAVSLLAGVTLTAATSELRRLSSIGWVAAIPAVVFLGAFVVSIVGQSDVLFRLDPVSISRMAYGASPFPEAEVISQYLKRQTKEDTRIAVVGSEPEIYFLSHRHSATGYIYVYPLFEPQKFAGYMQKEMAKEIVENDPEYIVLVRVSTSWQVFPNSDRFIIGWFKNYIAAHYELVGVADEVAPETRYVWGDAARTYVEQSEAAVEIFRRSDVAKQSSSEPEDSGPLKWMH